MNRTVHVDLGERSYEVTIGPGLLAGLADRIRPLPRGSSVVVIADSTVDDLYGRRALDALAHADRPVGRIAFPAGEAHKTLATWSGLFDELFALTPAIDRDTVIVALGGGVTGDMAGFVAATALRGLRLVQVPTTLLAAVDASVGGKTAVDHPAGKNLIGAFHQPVGVIIDVETLTTLPADQLRSGLAECIKHALIRDEALLDWIDTHADALAACDSQAMVELIARNVGIKARVVADDEREAGQRAHLNAGHTIGHAIEALVGLGNMTHGQAVALGMIAENAIAVERGLLPPAEAHRLIHTCRRVGLSIAYPNLDAQAVWQVMQHDKKNRGGRVRMILPRRLGEVEIADDVTTDEVARALDALADTEETA